MSSLRLLSPQNTRLYYRYHLLVIEVLRFSAEPLYEGLEYAMEDQGLS